MAWNEPGNNKGSDQKDNSNSDHSSDNNSNNKGPWSNHKNSNSDFDDLIKKFSALFENKKPNSDPFARRKNNGLGSGFVGFIAVIAIIVWVFSGFYTIGEAERGVVLRLGKYEKIVEPGLNWRPYFVDTYETVNVQAIRSLRASGVMLTKDENVVNVSMDIQYRVSDPYQYLYRVTDADDSLHQATDSALRAVIGDSLMDNILTSGRQQIRQTTQVILNEIIDNYDMGLVIVDVNFQSARPPEQVKDAFDDAIAAREDEERFIREAEAYKNEILPKATGNAERLKKEAQGYEERITNEAIGQVAQFEKLLPEYNLAPEIMRDRLYIDTMERVYSNTSKVLIDAQSNGNLLYLPLEQMLKSAPKFNTQLKNTGNANVNTPPSLYDGAQNNNVMPQSQPVRTVNTRQGRY